MKKWYCRSTAVARMGESGVRDTSKKPQELKAFFYNFFFNDSLTIKLYALYFKRDN